MIYLLDANCCIAYLRGRNSDLRARYDALGPDRVSICATVRSELVFGALRSLSPGRDLELVQRFLEPVFCHSLTPEIADVCASIRAGLTAKGAMIGPNDLQVAATAVFLDLTLVTHNVREFRRVDGLRIEDWEA